MDAPIFQTLMQSDNIVVSLLSSMVVILAGVVVYQWRYTMTETVPKWIWESLAGKIDSVLDVQKQMSLIIDERLKK